jgi:hypothetical protein
MTNKKKTSKKLISAKDSNKKISVKNKKMGRNFAKSLLSNLADKHEIDHALPIVEQMEEAFQQESLELCDRLDNHKVKNIKAAKPLGDFTTLFTDNDFAFGTIETLTKFFFAHTTKLIDKQQNILAELIKCDNIGDMVILQEKLVMLTIDSAIEILEQFSGHFIKCDIKCQGGVLHRHFPVAKFSDKDELQVH